MANPLLITDTNVAGALKRVYESFRVNTFPIATPLLAQIEKGKRGGVENMRWGGDGVRWDVVLKRPVGMSASQTGFFPPGAHALERQANVDIKRTYVQRQVDMLAVVGTKENEASFIPLARKIVREALDAARLGQQEILHGDGRAIKGLVRVVTDTTHITVDRPYGIDETQDAGKGGLLLDQDIFIAVLDTSGGDAILGTATVTAAVNTGDDCALTLDTAIAGMAAGDKVVAANTTTNTSFNNFPNGLTNIFNRGAGYNSLHGLSPAVAGEERWETTRLVAGTDTPDAAQPGEMDVWELAQRVAGRSGKDAKLTPGEFLLYTTPGVQKKLAESFLGQRQLTPADFRPIRGGFKAVEVFGLPLMSDYWTPRGTLYLIHLPSLSWVDRQDWVRLAFEGSGPWRFISGRDAYEINFGAYWNVAVLNRICHGMITAYTDTVSYDHVV